MIILGTHDFILQEKSETNQMTHKNKRQQNTLRQNEMKTASTTDSSKLGRSQQ